MEQGDFPIIEKDGWVYAPRVPVFDEHERDGTTFDEAKLARIAANCNARIADTGDEVPLVAGHAPDDTPEVDREVLGWASNFAVGTWGRERPRPCVFADFRFPSDKWAVARTLPRRSIELWNPQDDDAYIDPIALLGGTTPHRDLGLLYAKNSGAAARYRYSIRGGSVNKEEMVQCFAEMLESSDIGQYVRNQMEAAQGEAEDKPDEPADEPKDDKTENAEPDDKSDEKPGDEDDDKSEHAKEQVAQYARKYARLESEHKALAGRLAEMERRERVATRKADLLAVEAEGVVFDMAEELECVSDLEPAKYAKHLDKMRKRYSRSPVGVKVPVQAMPDHGAVTVTDNIGPEKVRLAAEYVLSGKAKNSEEALKLVGGI